MTRLVGLSPRLDSPRSSAPNGGVKASLPLLAALSLLLLLPACKVGKATTVAGHEQRWDELPRADKMAYMVDVVEPQMREAFQAHDATRFAEFDCATCHGEGASDGSFAMPNPQLPHLREAGLFKEHRKAHPDMVKFMWKGVEVPMAEMLGKTAGGGGEFNCHSCHIVDDE